MEQAAQSLQSHGLQVLFDVVLNHKLGADEKERVFVRRVEEHDRNDIDDHTFEALTYTRFTFPGRQENILSSYGIFAVLTALIILKIPMKTAFSK